MAANLVEEVTKKMTALPIEKQREVLDFLESVLEQTKCKEDSQASGHNTTETDARRKRAAWLDAHRDEYAGLYVAARQ